jgi:hypothetical protein
MSGKDMAMRIAHAALLGFILATSLSACSKRDDDDADTAGFQPPTNQTRADYLDMLDRSFTRMDVNGDGVIQASEISARRAARIKARDADHNGTITREDFIKGGLARFDRMDTNHDGVLTSTERRADPGGSNDTLGNVTP